MKPNNSDNKLFTDKPNFKFTTKLKKHLIKEEIILLILSVTAYFLKIEILLTASLFLLSVIYFFMYFVEYKTNNKKYKIIIIIFLLSSNWGKAVGVTGILYAIINRQGAEFMLKTGFLSLIISVLILAVYLIKRLKDEIFTYTELIRNLIISGVCLFFLIYYIV